MAETRRKLDQELDAGAVRIVRETARPVARVARELVRRRRENAELAMERDVLERSVALRAKEAMGRF